MLLPCRTQLIEFGTVVARRLKSFSLETEIWFDKAIEFDRVRRATRQWHGSFSKVPCRTKFIDHEYIYMCKCFDSNAPDCDAFFMLNLARLN